MRQAELVVALLERAGLDGEPEGNTLLRPSVLSDVELEAVRQRARPDGGVERQDGIGRKRLRLRRAWSSLLRDKRLVRRESQEHEEQNRSGA